MFSDVTEFVKATRPSVLIRSAVLLTTLISPLFTPLPCHGQEIVRVSVSSEGVEGNDRSYMPSISRDGRFVAFASKASNLVPDDTNATFDVFVRDLLQHTTERVSISTDGVQGNGSSAQPSISADGRFVSFASVASNLAPEDTETASDIFVRDRLHSTTERVSVTPAGAEFTSGVWESSISGDGNVVLFRDDLSIYLHERDSGISHTLVTDSNGHAHPCDVPEGPIDRVLSHDGGVVVYCHGPWADDVVVHDRSTGEVETIAEGDSATLPDPQISGDGSFISFSSGFPLLGEAVEEEGFLYLFDRMAGEYELVSVGGHRASLSPNGRFVSFIADNVVSVYDRAHGEEFLVAPSSGESVVADNGTVAFDSWVDSLIESDNNGVDDVFALVRTAGEIVPSFSWSPSAPTPGEPVRFQSTATGRLPLSFSWDFDGDALSDSAASEASWTYESSGVFPVTLTVWNDYEISSRTYSIIIGGNSTFPTVTSVARQWPGYFLQGTSLTNEFILAIDWQGTPGSIEIRLNGDSLATVPGASTGGAFSVDLGDLQESWFPNKIELVPTNGEGISGPTRTEYLYLFPYPSWLEQSLSIGGNLSFTSGGGEVKGEVGFEYPVPHLSGVVTIPDYVPYLAGELGVTETFGTAQGTFSSLGHGSLTLSGQTGFKALQGEIGGRVGGSGDFRFLPPEALVLTGASFSLGLSGTIRKEMGVVEAIPQLASFSTIPGIRWFNERAKLVGEISPGLEMTASFAANDLGHLIFREGTGTLEVDLKAALEVDVVSDHLTASGWVGGGGSLTLGVPEPFLRQLETHVEAGVDYKFDGLLLAYEGQFRCRAWCSWSPGTEVTCDTEGCDAGTSAMLGLRSGDASGIRTAPVGDVSLIEQDYGQYGRYSNLTASSLARVSSSAVPISVHQQLVLSNVFPGASPKLLKTSSGLLLLWEHQDPSDPVLQSTEISWSLDDGSGWTAPQLVVDDTQVELAPVAGVDSAGRVVAAWTRIKDPAFTTPISEVADLPLFYNELEVVTAVFDTSSSVWGPVLPLTSDSAMDTDLRLSDDGWGNIFLTWLKNPDGEFLSTATSPSELWFSLWDPATQTWSSPATVAAGLVGVGEHAPAFAAGEGFIIVPRDPDLALPGDGVLDLYTWTGSAWSTPATYAAGSVENRAVAVTYDSTGEGHVVWQRGGGLVWGTLSDPTPLAVRAGSDSMAFYGAQFFTNAAGNLTLVWQEVVENGPANIFARILDPAAGTWSADRRLTAEPEVLHRDLSGFYGDDGVLRAVYLATEITRTTRSVEVGGVTRTLTNIPAEGRTDLRLLEHDLVVDLAVVNSDLVISPPFPLAGDSVTGSLEVHNSGDFATGTFQVDLYAGDPGAGGTLVASSEVFGPFPGGDSVVLPLNFTMPAGAQELVALVDSTGIVTEISELNNRAAVFVGNKAPVAIVEADVTRGAVSLTVNFTGERSYDLDGDALTFSWAFGDGATSSGGVSTSHTFDQAGRFPVTLEVRDEHGAYDAVGVLISTCVTDVVLTGQTVSGAETFSGCNSVSAHSGFTVGATAEVTFRAGSRIVLGSGFSVAAGGKFQAVVDPLVMP